MNPSLIVVGEHVVGQVIAGVGVLAVLTVIAVVVEPVVLEESVVFLLLFGCFGNFLLVRLADLRRIGTGLFIRSGQSFC